MQRDAGGDLGEVVLVIVMSFLILAVGIAAISPVISTTTDNVDGEFTQTAVEIPSSGTWVEVNDRAGTNERVVTSRGYAIALTGANDSYIQSTADVDWSTEGTWTVSIWASADPDATHDEMTAVSVDGQVVITYDQTADEWRVWHYDAGSRESAEVSLAAPDQPGSLTNVIARSNGTHLSLYRNNTDSATVEIAGTGSADAPLGSENWHGELEELRVFDDALDDATRQELVDQPIDGQPDTNRTARVMFDEPYEDSQLLLFASGRMAHSNATFVDGFEGEELSEGRTGLLSDYQWSETGPQIKIHSGGDAGDAPVVYVDYDLIPGMSKSLLDSFTAAIGLAVLLPILLILGFVIITLQASRGRR